MRIFSFFRGSKEIGRENKLENGFIDLSNFRFVSSRHSKFEKGVKIASIDNCWRGIQINENSTRNNSYSLTIESLDRYKSSWGDDIRMSIKQMKIGNVSSNKLDLCGYGDDAMGVSFSDYGITVLLENNIIVKIILRYFYRDVELHYYR